MNIIKILTLAGLVLTFMIMSSGAAWAGGGTCSDTTYINSYGWVSKGYASSLVDARQAVKESLAQNRIRVLKHDNLIAAGSSRFKGQSQDSTYWVDVESITDRMTKVSVKTDTAEDTTAAKKIQCDIEKNM